MKTETIFYYSNTQNKYMSSLSLSPPILLIATFSLVQNLQLELRL